MSTSVGSPAPASRLGGVARGSTANLLGAVVSAGATLGLTVVVTQGLPQDSAGVFFSATSLFLVASAVGQLGTNVGLVYFLSRARSLGQAGARRPLFLTAARPVLVVAFAMTVALFLFARDVSEVINPDHVSRSAAYLRGTALFIPLAALENVTLAGTRGLGSMRANVITEQLTRPALQLLLVLLSVSLLGGRDLGLAWAVAYLPAALLAVHYWRRLGARTDRRGTTTAPTDDVNAAVPSSGTFWRFTAPRAAAGIAQVAMQRLDIVLVAAMAGAVPAAIYTASTRFLVLGQMGQRAISLAVQPRLGEALAVGDLAHAKQLYRVSTSWLMLITWPMYLMFALFGERLLGLFGSGYSAGHAVLLLLSLTMLLATGCGMVDMVLVMAGRSSWSLANLGLSLGVQMGVDVWLIPSHGILGAAVGWAAGIVAANVVPMVQVAWAVRLHPFGRSTIVTVAVVAACFGVVPGIVRLLLGNTWWGLLATSVLGGGAYLAALWRLRHLLDLTALAGVRRGRRATAGRAD